MKTNWVTVSAPGKLMLSGEWSVLERGKLCIVLAVDRFVSAKICESKTDKCYINLKSFGLESPVKISGTKITLENSDEKFNFAKRAIEIALEYLRGAGKEIKKFELETDSSNLSGKNSAGNGAKLGFGSSAAAVVAIISAILKLHGAKIKSAEEKEIIFKLGIIAHFHAQGKIGSGFDVAASTFGAALGYKRFDATWLEEELKRKSVFEIATRKWPELEMHEVKIPKNMIVLVVFTGKSASTRELVEEVNFFKNRNRAEYDRIMNALHDCTERLELAMRSGARDVVLAQIEENRQLLHHLSERTNAGLEIEEHRKIFEIAQKYGAASKFSGAGGGDCAICVCFDASAARKISKEMESAGMRIVPVKISKEGVELK